MLPLEIINLELDVAIAALDLLGEVFGPEVNALAVVVSVVEMAIDSLYGGK